MPIHPLAVVDPQAEIHPEATVGPFCVVKGKVVLAAGVELRNHATVYGNGRTTIGAGTVIFPGAVIGSDPQDLKFRGEDTETTIGARCRIHECATVSKGTAGGGMKTVIGDDCLMMAYAHVAHDCILDHHIVMANCAQLAGHVRVGRRCVVGAMVGLHHFVTMGELTMAGSMSGVRMDLPPFVIADGNPARPHTINEIGLRRDGWDEAKIQRVEAAFRALFRNRTGTPGVEVAQRLLADCPDDAADPVRRLCLWIQEHAAVGAKGRVQEAHRPPVVGGKPKK
jgi:UDP-N-acetylglucosamine acyltransferase